MASNAWTSNQAGLLVLDALMQDPSFCVVMARLQSKLNTLTALSSLQDVFRCIEESSRQAIAKQMAEVMLQNDEYFTALCRGIAKHIPPCRCQAKVSSPSAPTAASSSTATYVRRFLRQLMSLFSMNGAARSLETAEAPLLERSDSASITAYTSEKDHYGRIVEDASDAKSQRESLRESHETAIQTNNTEEERKRMRDKAHALESYRKAAAHGDADAQCSLGFCYQEGIGVEKDEANAVEWYRKAASGGDVRAQCNLGVCYQFGTGVGKDETKAVEWYRRAAAQGHADAQYNLAINYKQGTGIEKDDLKAMEWYLEAAEHGHARAQYNIGFYFQEGMGVKKDEEKAVKWYRKAAVQGDGRAQNNLGYCYQFGTGVRKDETEAVEWYYKAAKQGDERGQYSLGYCYHYGTGVEKDEATAIKWYRKAAAQGHANARASLDALVRPRRLGEKQA